MKEHRPLDHVVLLTKVASLDLSAITTRTSLPRGSPYYNSRHYRGVKAALMRQTAVCVNQLATQGRLQRASYMSRSIQR